jgi:ubiquinone/menaquinone biosynthesis C-methylase UbiE
VPNARENHPDGCLDETVRHVPPYSRLAALYDHVMDHVEYDLWANYIISIFKRFDVHGKRILELACGTGTLTADLARRGYDMTALDISPEMVGIAREKFADRYYSATLVAASMTDVPFAGPYDAIICLYDALNYLTLEADVVRTANEMSRLTAPGGIVVFDVCTVRNSELFFSNGSMVEYADGVRYERVCRFDRLRRIQENHFHIHDGDEKIVEHHYQRIYLLEEIERCFSGTDLVKIGLFDDIGFEAGSESSERVHFVYRKQ